jgi:Outer membrane lipoprotein-sorting protein
VGVLRSALALVVALGALTPALGQADPPPESQVEEARLRRETAALAVDLARRVTHPAESWVRLRVEIEREGLAFDRTRRLDVSRVVDGGRLTVRLRFLEPASLRGQAWLIVREADGEQTVHHYDPGERRVTRLPPLEPTWPVGGTALTLDDLRGDLPGAHAYTLVREGQLTPPDGQQGDARPVLVIEATPVSGPDGAPHPDAYAAAPRRLLSLDREHQVPLREEDRSADGRVLRVLARRFARGRSGHLRCAALLVTTPSEQRLDRVAVESYRDGVPAAHLDPGRFWVE